MTSKEKFIHRLHQARTAHIRWVNGIKLLVSGIEVDEKQVPIDAITSDFGTWFYNEAMIFSFGTSQLVLEDMEKSFIACHDKYAKIYPIFFNKKRNTLLGDLFGKKSGVNSHEMDLSQRYYEEIVALSDQLKHKMRIFEAQLMSLDEEKYNQFAAYTEEKSIEPANTIITETADTQSDEKAYFYGARGR